MPIKPENLARYPKDWPAIREKILKRADYECEWCRKPNGYRIDVGAQGEWLKLTGPPGVPSRWVDENGETTEAPEEKDRRAVQVILTVAHMDHQPENCDDDNLRALCQRCHNRYDAGHRAETRRGTLKAKRRQMELF